ncbi:DUF6894 family protein [Methylobacterium sp. E-045]|uniref:DUF6894 family protein n=1 Tax=Methylobacterium sp. E-045 TaxID=2836575 RepID=UPI001FBAFC4B|nr:hypothetical protein [Methylobacterium sp. E-045]MCJ2131267.1 hypothetical protein [Methylobacterium sp. E-045]
MNRYFFDINDGRNERDDVGTLCVDLHAAVTEAKKLLPAIAADEVPKDGERQAITVLISDADGQAVYLGALAYTGTWLIR